MKKMLLIIMLTVLTAGYLSMACFAQEIVSTVPACGLWAFDPVQIDALGDFEQAAVTFAPAGAVVWLDDRVITASDTISHAALARVRIFSAASRPAAGISPLYTDGGGLTRERLKIRCINPVF